MEGMSYFLAFYISSRKLYCQVAKYCSSDCQKSHFAFHKKDCKCIGKRRKEVAEEVKDFEEREKNGVRDDQLATQIGMDIFFDQDTDATVVCVRLADTILKTGYKESDTVEHGKNYYREALKCYLLPMKFMTTETGVMNHYFLKFRFIEERVLFLLILLGGDRSVLYDWTTGSSGLYTRTYKNTFFSRGSLDCKTEEQRRLLPHLTTSDEFPEERPRVLAGYSVLDLNFCGIMLLAGMRSLAIRREEEARLAACTNAHPGTLIGKVFLSHDIMEHITSFVVQKEQWWYDSELEDDLSHGDDCTQYITRRKEWREWYTNNCPPELCRHAQAQARIRKQIEMPLRVIRHVGSGDLINGIRDEIPLRPDTGRTQYGETIFPHICTLFRPK